MDRVLCLGHRFPDLVIEREVLAGAATVEDANPMAPEAVEDALAEVTGVLLGTGALLDAGRIRRMVRCRVIARYGVGVDNVDVEEAHRRRIVVAYVPDYCVAEVSDHALALILCAAKRLLPAMRAVERGEWSLDPVRPARRLSSLTVGLVGVGRIGQAVGRKAQALGMRVVAFDPWAAAEAFLRAGATPVDLPTLLRESDFVSIHCPTTPETRRLFGAAQFRQMKPTAWLVNTSRGEIVDDGELAAALDAGVIAGAALDVLSAEPLPPNHPLRNRENVLITPHVAWYSVEAQEEVRRRAAWQVREVLEGRTPQDAVVPR